MYPASPSPSPQKERDCVFALNVLGSYSVGNAVCCHINLLIRCIRRLTLSTGRRDHVPSYPEGNSCSQASFSAMEHHSEGSAKFIRFPLFLGSFSCHVLLKHMSLNMFSHIALVLTF